MKKPRMPARVIRWQYLYLVQRDGERCAVCGKSSEEIPLEIDHVNGDPEDNRPENLRLLCHRDNLKEMWRLINERRRKQEADKSVESEILEAHLREKKPIEKQKTYEIKGGQIEPEIAKDGRVHSIVCTSVGENKSGSSEGEYSERAVGVGEESPELRVARLKEPEYRKECLNALLRPQGITVYEAIYELSQTIDISPVTARRYLLKLTSRSGPFRIGEGKRGHQQILFRDEYWERLEK